MTTLAYSFRPNPPRLSWSLAGSFALHVLAVLLLPGLVHMAEERPPTVLMATLMPAIQAAREAIQTPPPAERTPVRPEKPKAVITASSSTPSFSRAVEPPPPAEPERPQPIVTAPVAPPPTAPISAVTPPTEVLALDEYGKSISSLLARQQVYPRMALARGWEGEVRLSVRVARKLGLLSVQVLHGSGYEILDQQAIQLVQNATLPAPPAALGDRELQLVIPVRFKLAKPA